MDHGPALAAVAELLQAPIATSVSGRGCVSECHPLAVGWGYGPHASEVAEKAFAKDPKHPLKTGIDTLLAIGVKFSEVSTGFYGNPQPRHVVHVDANPCNLGRVLRTDVCVHADAGLFLDRLLACGDRLRRPADTFLASRIQKLKADAAKVVCDVKPPKCGVDPLALVGSLRRNLPEDALLFTDVNGPIGLCAREQVVRARTSSLARRARCLTASDSPRHAHTAGAGLRCSTSAPRSRCWGKSWVFDLCVSTDAGGQRAKLSAAKRC
jgi:acetolactate synthase-1/2/3 large subunit